jgi:hypothetical protein
MAALGKPVERAFDRSPGHRLAKQELNTSMNVPHAQACRLVLENQSRCFADLAEPAPTVRLWPVRGSRRLAGLMTMGTCETLETGPELMV